MQTANTTNTFNDAYVARLHTALMIFLALLAYMSFGRDFMKIMALPDIDASVAEVHAVEMRYPSWMKMSNGSSYKIPDRLAFNIHAGAAIKHRAGSFHTLVDGTRLRLYRLTPIVLFGICFVLWLLSSINHPLIGFVADFLYKDRGFLVCYAYVMYPIILIFSLFMKF